MQILPLKISLIKKNYRFCRLNKFNSPSIPRRAQGALRLATRSGSTRSYFMSHNLGRKRDRDTLSPPHSSPLCIGRLGSLGGATARHNVCLLEKYCRGSFTHGLGACTVYECVQVSDWLTDPTIKTNVVFSTTIWWCRELVGAEMNGQRQTNAHSNEKSQIC